MRSTACTTPAAQRRPPPRSNVLRAGGIDGILLDCTLPGGLDPRLVPLADDVGVPVILMSGHPDMLDRVPGVERPCIQKPFSLTALLATIESVVPAEEVVPADEVGNPR